MNSNYAPIPILDRMSAVLDTVLSSPEGIRASELYYRENIPKTTLYRLLTSMVQNDLLTYHPDAGVYTIGPKFTLTYVSIDEQTDFLREIASPHLNHLADQIEETVKLSVLSGWSAYVIASVESKQTIRIKIDIGGAFPLHAGATGKVLMADFSSSAVEKYYEMYARAYTNTTIISPETMNTELELIRERGYAVDNGEYLPEILAIAVPIKNQAGSTIAALSIPYPSIHEDRVDVEQAIKLLKETAAAISASFSARGAKENPARLVGSLPGD